MSVERYVPAVGAVDVRDAVTKAFRRGRVLSCEQHDWHLVVRLSVDHDVGPLTLSEVLALVAALALDPDAVLVEDARGRSALTLTVDLDAPTPVEPAVAMRRARRQ